MTNACLRIVPSVARKTAAFGWAGLICLALAGAGEVEPPVVEAGAVPDRVEGRLGAVTKLPVPRFVSLKAAEGNVRRGPSLNHRIDWVMVRRDMPLEVTGEYGNWRRVRDREGAGGWIHYSLLSGVRTVIVTEPLTELRARPEDGADPLARAESGVVARLGECDLDWCRISAAGHKGWVEKSRLWGVSPEEIRD